MLLCLLVLVAQGWLTAASEDFLLERIQDCQTTCSQGLNCRTKLDYWSPQTCQEPSEDLVGVPVLQNVSVSTVMSCEGEQKCSLHLRIRTVLTLSDSVQGVSICSAGVGMLSSCRSIGLPRATRRRRTSPTVSVEDDCTAASPGQQLQLVVRTTPSICGLSWSTSLRTPGCTHADLRRNVPECITGHLQYSVNPERRQLEVSVRDHRHGYDYHLRLCHKRFVCADAGVSAVIKKDQPMRAVLPYVRPLPCLCIEGWSAVSDAPRVQVCPFKDRLEELWSGITFDPLEETLFWEPACSVEAVAALCQKMEDGDCLDLPHSAQNVSRKKIKFAKVDPHPELCMKFTAGSQIWIRCPFANGIKVWDVVTSRTQREELRMFSQAKAAFSVGLCTKSEASLKCRVTEEHHVYVEQHRAVDLRLAVGGVACSFCLQVKRLDVEFAATVVHCSEPCSPAPRDADCVVLAAVCLCAIAALTLILLRPLSARCCRKRNPAGTPPPSAAALDAVFPPPAAPDSPQCEKKNLIST
ncbi:interleukin-17 receptor E-like protein [Menidia menidia]